MYTQVTYILYHIHIKTHRKTRQAKLQNSDEKHTGNMMADDICYDLLFSINWGCCFFPLRKWIFSVARCSDFWVAKLGFLCCKFFPASAWFFFLPRTVFSHLGQFFRCLQNAFFSAVKVLFLLLQGVFSAALNFSGCEGICCWRFSPLQKQLFSAARHFFSCFQTCFFSVPMFFSCRELVFFALRGDKEQRTQSYTVPLHRLEA